MGRPSVITWPTPDTQGVCLRQSTSGAGNLIINGNLTINYTNPGQVIFPGYTRTISLTSTNNLSGVNFTITGTLNGSTISETRAGPNNNTVETTAIFDSVTSVSVNGAVTAVSVGSGTSGRSHWINYDHYLSCPVNVGLDWKITSTLNLTASFTIDDPNTVASPRLVPLLANQTATGRANATLAATAFVYTINSSNSTGTVTLTTLMQGLV